jgi:hypothetical protein
MLKKAVTMLTILTATVTLGVTTTVTPASARFVEYKLSDITMGDRQKFHYYCRTPLRCWDRSLNGLCRWKHPGIGAYAKNQACFDSYWS